MKIELLRIFPILGICATNIVPPDRALGTGHKLSQGGVEYFFLGGGYENFWRPKAAEGGGTKIFGGRRPPRGGMKILRRRREKFGLFP